MRRCKNTLILLSCMLLAACSGQDGGDSEDSGKATIRGVTDDEIRIGTHSDLSGPAALVGTGLVNGARMYFDEVNAAGGIHGRKIRFIVEDSQYQVPRAMQAVNKLIKRDDIFAMFAAIGTPMNNAAMPLLFAENILNLFPMTGARSMSEPFQRLQFVGIDMYYKQIGASARYFLEKTPDAVPCVAYQDSEFGQEIYDGAVNAVAEMGRELATVTTHKPTDMEFTSAVMRMREAGCNLVFLGTIHKDTILLLEAARKLGWDKVQWVGTAASVNLNVAEMESGASEGFAVFMQVNSIDPENPGTTAKVRDWWARYVSEFGRDSVLQGVEAYRSADILVHALRQAGPDLTVDSLIEAFESMNEYEDFFGGLTTFGPGDHFGPVKAHLTVVRDRKWVTLPESFEY